MCCGVAQLLKNYKTRGSMIVNKSPMCDRSIVRIGPCPNGAKSLMGIHDFQNNFHRLTNHPTSISSLQSSSPDIPFLRHITKRSRQPKPTTPKNDTPP